MGLGSIFTAAVQREKATWSAGGPPKMAELREIARIAPGARGTAAVEWVSELRAGGLFAGVYIDETAGLLVRGSGKKSIPNETVPLRGARARVEAAGQIRTRGAGGVMVGGIGVAMASKKDDRELYLTIEHEAGEWLVSCDPAMGEAARRFAARVNTAARAAG